MIQIILQGYSSLRPLTRRIELSPVPVIIVQIPDRVCPKKDGLKEVMALASTELSGDILRGEISGRKRAALCQGISGSAGDGNLQEA
jgi:hypothetical protein